MTHEVAIDTERRQSAWVTWLFNPFHYVAGGLAMGFGLALILLAGGIGALSGSVFDGVLDFHTAPHLTFTFSFYLLLGVMNWLTLSTVLYGAGWIVSGSRFRAVDVFGTQALARWPTLVMALAALSPGYQAAAEALSQEQVVVNAQFVAVSLVVLLMLAWMIALMWKGFSVACNVRGVKAVVAFVIGLLAAEAVSKGVIFLLLKAV